MPAISSSWSFDPSAFSLSQEARNACDLILDLDDDHWANVIDFGTWWILPFARTTTDQVIGIRLVPGTALSESPVVMLAEHEVETFVSKPAFLLTRLLFPGSVLKPESWDMRRDMSESAWRELEALHAALGGDDQLAAIKAVLHDTNLREVCVNGFTDPVRFAAALPDILPRLDSAAETLLYYDYAKKAVASFEAPLPLPDVKCWQAAAAAIAFITNQGEDDSGKPNALELPAAWEVFHQPPALDSFQAHRPSLNPRPVGKSQSRLSLDVAKVLATRQSEAPTDWKEHPLWQAALAIAADENGYSGKAHMDAVTELKKAGNLEEAFTALGASAYWFRVHIKKPFPQLLNAAWLLARESGWAETAEALERISSHIAT